jgi:hypothetical protein
MRSGRRRQTRHNWALAAGGPAAGAADRPLGAASVPPARPALLGRQVCACSRQAASALPIRGRAVSARLQDRRPWSGCAHTRHGPHPPLASGGSSAASLKGRKPPLGVWLRRRRQTAFGAGLHDDTPSFITGAVSLEKRSTPRSWLVNTRLRRTRPARRAAGSAPVPPPTRPAPAPRGPASGDERGQRACAASRTCPARASRNTGVPGSLDSALGERLPAQHLRADVLVARRHRLCRTGAAAAVLEDQCPVAWPD